MCASAILVTGHSALTVLLVTGREVAPRAHHEHVQMASVRSVKNQEARRVTSAASRNATLMTAHPAGTSPLETSPDLATNPSSATVRAAQARSQVASRAAADTMGAGTAPAVDALAHPVLAHPVAVADLRP